MNLSTRSDHTPDQERNAARRVFLVLVTACVLTLAVAITGSAEQRTAMPAGSGFKSMSARTLPGADKQFYRVPGGKAFYMTQACLEHGAMKLDVQAPDGAFSVETRGCTSFRPAYVVTGAATFTCKNRAGQPRSCRMVGRLIDNESDARRAVFIDVDEELAANAATEPNDVTEPIEK